MPRPLRLALEGSGAAFFLGAFVYVVVSYAVAARHHPRVPLGVVVREALRELVVVTLSQPLLPLFFLLGRRMGGRGARPIVLVHGYFQNRVDFVYIAHILRVRGLGPIYAFNYWTFGRVEHAAARLGRFVERVCKEAGADKVDLVCHSLGGLVAGELLRKGGRDAEGAPLHVRKCATIASPHGGVAWPGPIVGKTARVMRRGSRYMRESREVPFGVPMLSVYSTFDNVVYPIDTSSLEARSGRDVALPYLGHLAILFDRRAAIAVADFLSDAPPSPP